MIHFLLTPDKSASLALKRLVARQGARMDVVIGTWPELLTVAKNSHLLPAAADDWQTRLATAIKNQTDAFWSESLAKVPAEEQSIIGIISRNLVLLLEGAGPDRNLPSLPSDHLTGRLRHRVQDFSKLHASLETQLPPDLHAIRAIMAAGAERILRNIRVYRNDGWPRLNPWQQALVNCLNSRADSALDRNLSALLEDAVVSPSAPHLSALRHLQANLFTAESERHSPDETVQWLGCRDHLQEVEIAAGMIQKALFDNMELKWHDFALLLPADDRYHQTVLDAFSLAGIPLAGLGQELSGRDLGREALYYFLLCKKSLAPAMVLATLLTSPLMPWDGQTGNRLAQKVMKGDFKLEATEGADVGVKVMLALIRKSVATPVELSACLGGFLKQLPEYSTADHPLSAPRKRATETGNNLVGLISAMSSLHDELSWGELLDACQPQPVAAGIKLACDLSREGVAVFHEGEEPWRKVRQLLVLGCSEGHYPQGKTRSPVFFDSDLKAVRDTCGLDMETAEERGRRHREVFRRQLCSASDGVTFLVPRRDGTGKSRALSPALAFMASLLDGVKDDEGLIVDLDSADGRSRVRGLAVAEEREAATPWKPQAEDLELGIDLIALKDGSESPSRLEKLMVSPLAWLFERLRVESQEWVTEKLDVSVKGTLAHTVFEKLFAFGVPIPDNDNISARVPDILDESIAARYPFLKRAEWKVERAHLAQEIIKSAQRWQEILKSLNAMVVATEVRLKGVLKLGLQKELQIHGDADLLLEIPGNRLFVADYKKSSSTDRRKRMKEGYDHQATLYGAMIATGGVEYPDKVRPGLVEELARFRDGGEIRSLYYLMNDQQVLTDSSGWLPSSFPGQPEMGDGISREAMPLIVMRIGQVRIGKVELNSDGNEKEFKYNYGITAAKYSVESSPLVKMFSKSL